MSYFEELNAQGTWWKVADTEEEMREWLGDHLKYTGRVGRINENFAVEDVTAKFADAWLEAISERAEEYATLTEFEEAYPWISLHNGHTMRVVFELRGPVPEERPYPNFSDEP